RIPLTLDNSSDGGTLFGNSGGFFREYTIDYQGNNAVIIVTMDVNNSYSSLGNLVGFNIYTPDGAQLRGEPIGGDPNSLRARLSFSDPHPGQYLVQLYSYEQGLASSYTIGVT